MSNNNEHHEDVKEILRIVKKLAQDFESFKTTYALKETARDTQRSLDV